MRFFKKIENYISNIKLNAQLNKYKYVHIMFNDKFNKPFVDFLNKNFDNNEHIILCKRWFVEFPFPIGKNVFEIKTLKNLDFAKNEKIICHSLFDQELVDYLYNNQSLLKTKAYWMIWGGDLYNAPRDEKNDFVRKNFKGYISDSETKVLNEKYGTNKQGLAAWYVFPISNKILNSIFIEKKNYIKIQINNSCDELTLEMLNILSRFRDENIKITTILSYGQMQFKDEIIQKGKEIFGDKFEYIKDYMTPSEYAQYLAQNDILILNQNRQQGFGNIIASLYLGKKVFIRSNISTYKYFTDNKIVVHDSHKIKELTFDEFINENYKDKNKIEVQKFFDELKLALAWRKVFND